MSDKALFINEYFKRWESDIAKAEELLKNQRYHLEGILVLSCYLGAFASMRFPSLQDNERYVRVTLTYSGKRDFYEQIDLLFLYQWPRSKLKTHGSYHTLRNHREIVESLARVYGSEGKLGSGNRYVSPNKVIKIVLAAGIAGFDESNFRKTLRLFSLVQLLYRYLRCDAVHNAHFPFFDRVHSVDGNIRYQDNHAITGQVLLETVQGVRKAICAECLENTKWPHEL